MNIPRLFILRPVATILLAIGTVIFGVLGYIFLPVSNILSMDFPVIEVTTLQPGGTSEEVSSSITAPLERYLGTISGVREMISSSRDGQSHITLAFNITVNINTAARVVSAAVQAARKDLPNSLYANPTYKKVNSQTSPIMVIALTSTNKMRYQLYDLANNVVQQKISAIKGVGEVKLGGGAQKAFHIDLNPTSLFQKGIGFKDVRAALASANAHTPKGFIDQEGQRFWLETNDQVTDATSYKDLVIAWRNGNAVHLSDVATKVSEGAEDLRTAGYFNTQSAVLVVVLPQANSNIIDTVSRIKKLLPSNPCLKTS